MAINNENEEHLIMSTESSNSENNEDKEFEKQINISIFKLVGAERLLMTDLPEDNKRYTIALIGKELFIF